MRQVHYDGLVKQLSVCGDSPVKHVPFCGNDLVKQEYVVADGLVRHELVVADGLMRQEFHCAWYRCAGMYDTRFFLVTLGSSFWE